MILDRIQNPDDVKKLNEEDLPVLAGEIRSFMVDHVAETGGHLAPSLGVVELVLAMCRVFDFPRDRVIFDVGHQSYAYKILTGRRERFADLRRFGGLSGFPKREESVYDAFNTGHSSTSISAALGLAVARDLKGEDYKIISVIGDGALTGGMAYEALNNAGSRREDLIVILNDNQMSISKNVGAMANYLAKARTAPHYDRRKQHLKKVLSRTGGGARVLSGMRRVRDSLKNLMVQGMFFEEMGFTYLGPIDGHDLPQIEQYLQYCRNVKGPVLLHVLTKKGKGYPFAEQEPDRFHGISAFDPKTGKTKNGGGRSFSTVFGETLIDLAKEDPRILAVTAAMPDGTGLNPFAKMFPDRFFDVGIAEAHAVTYCAGLAENGMKPCAAIYSSFLQRGTDQIFHDVALQNLPVVFAVDRAGVVGEDGETHQGIFDIALLRAFPNLTLLSPSTEKEMKQMFPYAFSLDSPVALRYPRGKVSEWDRDFEHEPLSDGRGEIVKKGKGVVLIALGIMMDNALAAAEILKQKGIEAGVCNPRFASPLNIDFYKELAEEYDTFVTVEDHVLAGGFGSALRELMAAAKRDIPVVSLGYDVGMVPQGKREELLARYGLSAEKIAERVAEIESKS